MLNIPKQKDRVVSKDRLVSKETNNSHRKGARPVGFRGLTATCVMVILIEFGERLAYYGTKLMYGPYTKTMLDYGDGAYIKTSNFSDLMTYSSCLMGAYVADAYLGRYKTITLLAPIYLMGITCLFLSSRYGFDDYPYLGTTGFSYAECGLWMAIIFMSVGCGFIKPNINVFAADQLRDENDRDPPPETLQALYMWWYFAINIGSFLGQCITPFLSGIQFSGLHLGPQKTRCLERSGLSAAKSSFCYGPNSPIPNFCQNQGCEGPVRPPQKLLELCCGPRDAQYLVATNFWLGWFVTLSIFISVFSIFYGGGYFFQYKVYPPKGSFLGSFFRTLYGSWKYRGRKHTDNFPIAWLTVCKGKIDGVSNDLIDQMRMTLHACKIFPFLILFWFVNGQSYVYGYNQCKGPMRTSTPWMGCNPVQNFNTVSILLMIPLLDFYIYPFLKKRNMMPSLLTRIGIGMFIESFAFLSLALFQHIIHQRGTFNNPKDSTTYALHPGQTHLSIWLQVIPYCLTGLGEVIGNIATMEYAYTNAPNSMKSIVMAFNLFMSALASILGISLSGIAGNGKAEGLLWCVGGSLCILSFFIFYLFQNHKSGSEYFPKFYSNAVTETDDLVQRGLLSSVSDDESDEDNDK